MPGPVNSAMCVIAPSAVAANVPATSCLSTASCADGSTLAFWIYVPLIANWTITGNLTLIKYGKLEVSYGLVNDMRNGTTKPIPTMMFSLTSNAEHCQWVSMIYGSMITNAWSHIAVSIDSMQSLKIYYNGKENFAMKEACQPYNIPSVFNLVAGKLNFTCVDEIVTWNRMLSPDKIEYIYNATTFGGKHFALNFSLYFIVFYYMVLYCFILYCIILYCIVFYRSVLLCIV